jgi:exonuclease III
MKPLRWTLIAAVVLAAVTALLPARAESASPRLRICTANIQHTPDMPDWKVRADARETRRYCDLVLYQEIRERADHRALQADGWKTTGYRSVGGVPIAWRTSRLSQVTASRLIKVSRPTPPCANGPSYNPARYVTLITLKLRGTSKRLSTVSLHFPQRRTKCHQATTSQRWREAYANTKAALPSGPLVIGGDWNRREGEIRPMTRWHWITEAPRSFDHTAVARTGFRVVDKFSRRLYSDHALRGAVVTA